MIEWALNSLNNDIYNVGLEQQCNVRFCIFQETLTMSTENQWFDLKRDPEIETSHTNGNAQESIKLFFAVFVW